MAAEGTFVKKTGSVKIVATVALVSGQVVQLADGRAGIYQGLNSAAVGATVAIAVEGQFKITKTSTINILAGGEVFFDASANAATIETDGDFFMGVAVADALAGTDVTVDLNVAQVNEVSLNKGEWTTEVTLGLGVTMTGLAGLGEPRATLSFDAQAEIAQAALFSAGIDVDEKPILEAMIGIFDIGDNAALDINFGLAVGSHASDFESIAQFVAIQLDGAALSIFAHSDDGTTDVTLVDTTVDAGDNTFIHLVNDCRDKTSCKIYLDGVRVLSGTTFVLTLHTGNLSAIAHIEKTSNDTLADVRVSKFNVRKQAAAA